MLPDSEQDALMAQDNDLIIGGIVERTELLLKFSDEVGCMFSILSNVC